MIDKPTLTPGSADKVPFKMPHTLALMFMFMIAVVSAVGAVVGVGVRVINLKMLRMLSNPYHGLGYVFEHVFKGC